MFSDLSLLLLLSAFIGALTVYFKQPLIVAFIVVGIVAGPAGFDVIPRTQETDLLATVGISLLLFVVGLRLDLHIIRGLGTVALATGLGQVIFTSAIGYAICVGLGLQPLAALYAAVALTFSSTIIIVKLLSDKREIDALHGRIAVGLLIVQDLVVIVALMGLSIPAGATIDSARSPLALLWKDLALLAGLALAVRYVIPRLIWIIARSQELLVLFAIAWAVSLAALGDFLGFSKEVGAFLAGVSLASTPFRDAIGSRLVTLRDFLLLFFFVRLGAELNLVHVETQLTAALVLSLFVLVGNPLIVMLIMGTMGYRKRTGFLVGLTVAQISEFSLVLGALGLRLGHIDHPTMTLITLVGLTTIGLSSYLIVYSHPLYERFSRWLGIFERKSPWRELADDSAIPADVDVLLFGLGRFGSNIALHLQQHGMKVMGIDFDPRVVAEWRREGKAIHFGDAEDPELLLSLPLATPTWVVCAVPQLETGLILLNELRAIAYKGKVALTAHSTIDEQQLKHAGADLVLLPFVDAAERAAELLASDNAGEEICSKAVKARVDPV